MRLAFWKKDEGFDTLLFVREEDYIENVTKDLIDQVEKKAMNQLKGEYSRMMLFFARDAIKSVMQDKTEEFKADLFGKDSGFADIAKRTNYINLPLVLQASRGDVDSPWFLTKFIGTIEHEALHQILEEDGISYREKVKIEGDLDNKETDDEELSIHHYIINSMSSENYEFFFWEGENVSFKTLLETQLLARVDREISKPRYWKLWDEILSRLWTSESEDYFSNGVMYHGS
jgi:hypothetical protein